MSRVFNKMYIVSGGVSPEDRLSSYRFQTRGLLDKVPDWQWTHRLNDDAIEVDTKGKRVKYDTCRGDNYWNTWDNTKLKDLKCRRVACINDRWTAIDIDPFTDDTDDYLEKKGYRRKLGEHGSGWYDGEHMPKFETAVFTYIYRNMQLVWDDRRNRHAGIVPHMKDRELRIYSGKSRGSYDKQIGNILVDGTAVVAHLDDRTYRFCRVADRDFTDFARLCVDSRYVRMRSEWNLDGTVCNETMERMKATDTREITEWFGRLFHEYTIPTR